MKTTINLSIKVTISNFNSTHRIRALTSKDNSDNNKKHYQQQLDLVTNPSIGEFSIGAYTMTSLSVSGSNLFDFESKKSRTGGAESLNVNDTCFSEAQNDAEISSAASNMAIASSSINTFQLTEKKSMNPSVTAMAGSIK